MVVRSARDEPEPLGLELRGEMFRVGDDLIDVRAERRLERLAEAYVEDRGLAACAWRVDVISLVIGRGGELVRLDDLTGAYR